MAHNITATPKLNEEEEGEEEEEEENDNDHYYNDQTRPSLWQSFKNEFTWENFSLSFEKNSEFQKYDPNDVIKSFHSSIWPCVNRFVYLVYRIGIAVYYTIWFIESIVRNHEFRKNNYTFVNKNGSNLFEIHPWPFYMTSWSLAALFLHLWIAAFIVLYFYSINEKSKLAQFFTYLFSMTNFTCCESSSDGFAKSQEKKPSPAINIVYFDVNKLNADGNNATSNDNYTHSTQNHDQEEAEKRNVLLKRNEGAQSSFKSIKCFNCNCMSTKSNKYKVVSRSDCCLVRLRADEAEAAKQSLAKQPQQHDCDDSEATSTSNTYLLLDDKEAWSLWIHSHVPSFILTLIKISWLLYNLIAIAAIVVTIGYFSYVYIADLDMRHTWLMELGNLHRHGFNSLVAIIDICILAYPVRIHHHVYTNLYGWIYAGVILVYWLFDTENNIVYEIIDYNKPLLILAMYTTLSFVAVIMQCIHFFIYQLKLMLRNKLVEIYYRNKSDMFCMNRQSFKQQQQQQPATTTTTTTSPRQLPGENGEQQVKINLNETERP